mmetsp:Transcript_50673/g.94957  ORF Transcript_50673/g.94957 Transcript_50673/m.94957 type:complete len:268 (-) Transcript_50673:22-825(-)
MPQTISMRSTTWFLSRSTRSKTALHTSSLGTASPRSVSNFLWHATNCSRVNLPSAAENLKLGKASPTGTSFKPQVFCKAFKLCRRASSLVSFNWSLSAGCPSWPRCGEAALASCRGGDRAICGDLASGRESTAFAATRATLGLATGAAISDPVVSVDPGDDGKYFVFPGAGVAIKELVAVIARVGDVDTYALCAHGGDEGHAECVTCRRTGWAVTDTGEAVIDCAGRIPGTAWAVDLTTCAGYELPVAVLEMIAAGLLASGEVGPAP